MNEKFNYLIENGEVTITKCTDKSATEIEIPSEIDGYPVKRISDCAFKDCKNLKNVKIGKGLRTIGRMAFYNCSKLTEIEIPKTVIKISGSAFSWCKKLSKISFETPNKECRVDCTSGLNLNQCVDYNWR